MSGSEFSRLAGSWTMSLTRTQSRKSLARSWRKEIGVKKERGKIDSKNESGARELLTSLAPFSLRRLLS